MVSAAPAGVTTSKDSLLAGFHRFIAQVKKTSWELITSLNETPRPDWDHHLDEDPDFIKAHPREAAAIRAKYHPTTNWDDDTTTTEEAETDPPEQEATTLQDTAMASQDGNPPGQDTNTTAQDPSTTDQETDMTGQDSATTLSDTTSTNEMATIAQETTEPTDQLGDGNQKLNGTDEDIREQNNASKNNEGLEHEKSLGAQEGAEAHEEGTPKQEKPNDQVEDATEIKQESPDELKARYREYHKADRRKHRGAPHNP
ncbi:hypothetical protein WDU94_001948 [Cyamophila willieti]